MHVHPVSARAHVKLHKLTTNPVAGKKQKRDLNKKQKKDQKFAFDAVYGPGALFLLLFLLFIFIFLVLLFIITFIN